MNRNALRNRTIRALSWSFLDSTSNRLLSVAIAIVLARTLEPDHFGLMGMLAIVIALATLIVEGGLSGALIQKQDLTSSDTNTVFYVNVGIGILVALAVHVLAPRIASFYNEPELARITSALSLLFVIHGFAAIQLAQMTKELRFKRIAATGIVSLIVSGAIAIFMANTGFGVWSLVAQQISLAATRAAGLWLLSNWRPQFIFSARSFRELFSYGWRIMASGVLGRTFEDLYLIVIGRAFGAVDLGYYTRAAMLQKLPTQTLSQIVNRVTFPVFSSIQDQPERLRNGMRKAITMLVLINFPLLTGMAVTAEPLVITILTDRWLPAVPFVQLLCLAGLLYPMHSVNLNLLKASGRADLYLRISLLKQGLAIFNIATTWRFGIEAIIVGQIVLSFVAYFINARYSRRIVDYGIGRQVLDVAPYAAATCVMAIGVWGIGQLPFRSPPVALVSQALTGMALYFAVCLIFRLEALMDALQDFTARVKRTR